MSRDKRQRLFRALEILPSGLPSEEGAEPDHHQAYPPEREEFKISSVECEVIVECEINKNIVDGEANVKEEKVEKIRDKVPAVELGTAEEADQPEGLHSQPPQSPDKEFVKVLIDNVDETYDNAEAELDRGETADIVESGGDIMRAKVGDKEFVKLIIDNGNETDDNTEVYNDDYNSDNLGVNFENEIPAVELKSVEEADQPEDLRS